MDTRQKLTLAGVVALGVILFLIFYNLVSSQEENYKKKIQKIREQKDQRFKNSPDSFVPVKARKDFDGLPYFAIDPAFKFEARFEPMNKFENRSPLKANRNLTLAGRVHFNYQGEQYDLLAYWENEQRQEKLFIPFSDKTNGKTTYGGGRYISMELEPDNSVTLDFNRAYNPECAYDPQMICPKPPPENSLPFPVKAGEKDFPYKTHGS